MQVLNLDKAGDVCFGVDLNRNYGFNYFKQLDKCNE